MLKLTKGDFIGLSMLSFVFSLVVLVFVSQSSINKPLKTVQRVFSTSGCSCEDGSVVI